MLSRSSRRNAGQGMGVHFLNLQLIGPTLDPTKPQVLIHEPDGDNLRLVAAEWFVRCVLTDQCDGEVPKEGVFLRRERAEDGTARVTLGLQHHLSAQVSGEDSSLWSYRNGRGRSPLGMSR